MDTTSEATPAVQFTISWEHSRVTSITTTSPVVNHFLHVLKLTRSYHTWVNYAHDLQTFFKVVLKPPELINRTDCVFFIEFLDSHGRSSATVNRHLATLSSLFSELQVLDPATFPQNPIYPRDRKRDRSRHQGREPNLALYRKQAERVPTIIPPDDLQKFVNALPTWRDRTLILLMCFSCLRVSEVVAIEFQHIECSRCSIFIPAGKGGLSRTTFMNRDTFIALNRYLDLERQTLFPEQDALFVAFKGSQRGQQISVNAVQQLIRYYSHRCNLPYIHAHLFRHTGITALLQNGMSESAIRKLVGHRSPDSTQPYLHLADAYVQREFDQAQIAFTHLN